MYGRSHSEVASKAAHNSSHGLQTKAAGLPATLTVTHSTLTVTPSPIAGTLTVTHSTLTVTPSPIAGTLTASPISRAHS